MLAADFAEINRAVDRLDEITVALGGRVQLWVRRGDAGARWMRLHCHAR